MSKFPEKSDSNLRPESPMFNPDLFKKKETQALVLLGFAMHPQWNADSTRCPVQRSAHPSVHLCARRPLCPSYGMNKEAV
ncbi:hypothetical protein X801_10684 [Opisthorchis viverrini]|uniref:Uncharacterized protein n=1 Tax=Opisthorchis viverrini TaxID=6198 RepID=A0A1S8WGG4_OPIVI|nr:hypothetical protein X801_10684 [Opisthorchis viverrini]